MKKFVVLFSLILSACAVEGLNVGVGLGGGFGGTRSTFGGISIGGTIPLKSKNTSTPQTPQLIIERELAIELEEVNKLRARNGAKPLVINKSLQQYANVRANELMQKFSHYRPNGLDALRNIKSNSSYVYVAENIALNHQLSGEAIVKQWSESSGHFSNMINKDFTAIGIGVSTDGNGQFYWVQIFGDTKSYVK